MPSPRKKSTANGAEEIEVNSPEQVIVETSVIEAGKEEVVTEQVIDVIDETAQVVEANGENDVDETETQKEIQVNPKETKVPEKIAPVEEEVIAEAVAPKQKLYRIKFLENHEFYVGVEKHNAKKGDVLQVELHLANLFGQRKIAYMLS